MEAIIESQESGLVITFGLMKFSPKELYHHAALMITADSVIAFDDTVIDVCETSSSKKFHKAKMVLPLGEIGYVIDEELIGRRELKKYHRLSITSKDGLRSLILFYSKKEKKSALAFINQLNAFKIEVAKGKSDISL